MRSLNPVVHELAGALRLIGMRDRLRCPGCHKVGTWKPHGGLWDRWHDKDRSVRRWLCKWCGFYVGPEGEQYAFPSAEHGAWALVTWGFQPELTPEMAIEEHYGRVVDPWRG
jgi:hypothetical protein